VNGIQWFFHLEGDELDLQGVSQLFDQRINLTRKDSRLYLVMELPFTSIEAQAALAAAEGLLAKVNATAQVMYGNHETLRIGAVSCLDQPGGLATQVVMVGSGIRSRARMSIKVAFTTDSAPEPEPLRVGDRFLHAADHNKHFDRALYLYGALPQDWRGLYMVLEAAQDGNEGETGLIAKKWVTSHAIKDFKATANSFRAIQSQARHGTITQGSIKARQTLGEARSMIRQILECWEREISSTRGS
jgi:hypothetical protein